LPGTAWYCRPASVAVPDLMRHEVVMKVLTIAFLLLFNAAAWAAPAGGEPNALGLWEQVDDKTSQPESWFRITEKDGVYTGTIVKMFSKPGDPPPESFRCTKCEGDEKNAPVLGLALIKGMKRNGLAYESGTIMDPRDGTVYRALMNLSADGKKLEVRGYLGFAWAGRSQMWNRLPDNAMDPPRAPPKAAPKK
jgi:uncharacterized protein (DUF2147 family)